MVTAKKTGAGKRLESAAVGAGRELGALVSRLERETRRAARKGAEMRESARKRTVRLLRQASRTLDRLAGELER